MKTFVSLLLLAGATVLAAPASAQQAISHPAAEHGVKPVAGSRVAAPRAAHLQVAADTKLTWQQRRAIRKRKLTPYAEAMLHNELLREEPTKSNGAGLL